MMGKKEHTYVLAYIIICTLIFSFIYIPLFITGKMYMYNDIGADTFCSYWPSLAYAPSLLCDFKLWDTTLGLGSSTMPQISAYICDPFNWIIYPFSAFNMDIGIFLALISKNVVLSCFTFKYFGKMHLSYWPQIIASICVVFSGYFVGWGQHYHFASMFCIFIISLYFFEKWLQDNQWLVFVLILSLLAAMTPYFCYMILIFLGIYYLIRRISIWDNWKKFVSHMLKTVALCMAGIGLAAVIFLPTIFSILSSPRLNSRPSFWFVPGSIPEYFSLLLRSLSNNILGINSFLGYSNWYESPFVFTGIIFFFMFPFFIKKYYVNKQTRISCFLFAFAIVFLHSTALIFNALSEITYRWTFLLMPIMGLVIGNGFSEIEKSSEHNIRKYSFCTYIGIILILFTYIIVLLSNKQQTQEYEKIILESVVIVFVITTLYFVLFNVKRKTPKYLMIAITVICTLDLTLNGMGSVQTRSLIDRGSKNTMSYFDDSRKLMQNIQEQDNSFYRMNKRYAYIDLNDSMMQDYNGEKFYSSMLNDSYWNMQEMFNLKIKYSNYFYGFDDIQSLRNINAGKYMISTEKRDYYGFKLIAQEGEKYLYENENNIGFGFLYSKYMLRSEFDSLKEMEKQNVIYDTCVIDDKDKLLLNGMEKISSFDGIKLNPVNYQINSVDQGKEILLSENYSEPLVLKITNQSEVPVEINGYTALKDKEYSHNDIFNITAEAGSEKYYNLDILNLDRILLNVPSSVSVSLYKMDMARAESSIEQKRSNSLKLNYWDDEYYSGVIKSDQKALLYLPIIFDSNWQVYVNKERVPIIRANGGFCAVLIEGGENNIEISYVSNAFFSGKIISACTLVIIGCICLYGRLIRKYGCLGHLPDRG